MYQNLIRNVLLINKLIKEFSIFSFVTNGLLYNAIGKGILQKMKSMEFSVEVGVIITRIS